MDDTINIYSLLSQDAFARQRIYTVTYYIASDKSELDDPDFLAGLCASDYRHETINAANETDAIFKLLGLLCANYGSRHNPAKALEFASHIKVIDAKIYKYLDAEGQLTDSAPTEADRWRYIASHYPAFDPALAAAQAQSIDDFNKKITKTNG